MFWKYKIKEEKEIEVLDIVTKICGRKETEVLIDPINFNCFIKNKELHYDIVILTSSVIITNSVFSIRQSFSDRFIPLVKKVVFERASKDRQEILEEILEREKDMLNKMKSEL